MYAFGSTIDSRTNAASGFPARAASPARLSRSGPVVALEPAGLKVWHAEQPLLLKAASPGPPPDPWFAFAATRCWVFTHAANAVGLITTASERMSAWPSPQSSVQTTG